MKDAKRLFQLLSKFLLTKESALEKKELLNWLDQQKNTYNKQDQEKLQAHTRARLIQSIRPNQTLYISKQRRWLIGAASLLLTTFIGYQHFFEKQEVLASEEQLGHIAPAREHAIMEFENGKEVNLDALQENDVLVVDGLMISKNNQGEITYKLQETNQKEIPWNCIYVPEASTFNMTLSDGTKVLLNAGSKLRFPIVFGKGDRIVELEGEGYFEVSKQPNSSIFKVKTAEQQIEVLGTKFNIKAYPDEGSTHSSLYEGSVKVIGDSGESLLLHPNQEASSHIGSKLLLKNVNMDNVLGWTKGKFCFDGTNTDEVIREIARWYNIQVQYDQKLLLNHQYRGWIPRNLPLNRLIELLNYAGLKSTATISNKNQIKLQIH